MPLDLDTNLLAIPFVQLSAVTGNNEDWVDSLLFLVDSPDVPPPQLDLTGIRFEMEVRRAPTDHEVIIRASTDDGTLSIGEPPNTGFLIININHLQMLQQVAGAYVADIVGTDQHSTRRVVGIDLTIANGITRP
jgi:hypothetical protein